MIELQLSNIEIKLNLDKSYIKYWKFWLIIYNLILNPPNERYPTKLIKITVEFRLIIPREILLKGDDPSNKIIFSVSVIEIYQIYII